MCAFVCLGVWVCVCVCECECVRFNHWGGVGRHGHICILEATLHTSNCIIHLFITSPYMSISKNIQTKVSQMCNPFVIGDQFLRL